MQTLRNSARARGVCTATTASMVLPLLALTLPAPGFAGALIDSIRSVDLNDYALGIGISTSSKPYADADSSGFLYPYLTSLQDSTLTEDALLLEGSEIGGRVLSADSDWEFGLQGRVQTLGFGSDTGPALKGLQPRGWTLEAGGMVGWRGGPVQIHLKQFWELLGEHSGTTQELRFSYPHERPYGFFVPYVTLVRQSSEYANHYFGITPAESTPDRPAYEPGSALNVIAGFRWGHRLNDDWLLSMSANMQFLDDVITQSAIVDEDYTGSVSVGIAYNRALFRRQQPLDSAFKPARWELSTTYIDAHISSIERVDSDLQSAGSVLNLEDSLGVSTRQELIAGRIVWRLTYFHRFEAEYLRISRHGSVTLDAPVSVGAVTLSAGETLVTDSVLELPQISYGYSFMRDAQKELGVSFGVHVPTVQLRLTDDESNTVRNVRASAPLPILGVFGSLALPADMSLRARIQLFRLDVDNYDGHMTKLELGLDYAPIDWFALSVGWTAYRLNLNAADDDFRGKFKLDYQGPQIAAILRF